MSKAEAKARYAAKRPSFTYCSDSDLVEDLRALRHSFPSDQAMMSHLVRLGLTQHLNVLQTDEVEIKKNERRLFGTI